MKFIIPKPEDAVRLKLSRDRRRAIKQGHPWIYKDCFEELPRAKAGSRAHVRDRDGSLIAFGMYDPESPLAVRVCAIESERLDDDLVFARLESALQLRRSLFRSETNGFRLLNGEGDGLPGLVCDIYHRHAVLKLDGAGPAGFWRLEGFCEWLVERLGIQTVYLKHRAGGEERGELLFGTLDSEKVTFLENNISFQVDIVQGQKTGFFFDQRDNRERIGMLSSGKRVLNLFAYTGGFSLYAGAKGASHVTTVDLAKPAILEAEANWALNSLPAERHTAIAADCFKFLEDALQEKKQWDLIIVDPPSFAHAERHVDKAKDSYASLFALALQVLAKDSVIAFSSCSSHIQPNAFLELCQSAFSTAKRRGSVFGVYGQPGDHPFPLVCQELQYLKFVLCKVL